MICRLLLVLSLAIPACTRTVSVGEQGPSKQKQEVIQLLATIDLNSGGTVMRNPKAAEIADYGPVAISPVLDDLETAVDQEDRFRVNLLIDILWWITVELEGIDPSSSGADHEKWVRWRAFWKERWSLREASDSDDEFTQLIGEERANLISLKRIKAALPGWHEWLRQNESSLIVNDTLRQ